MNTDASQENVAPLAREDFRRRAADILALIAALRAEVGLDEAIRVTLERYADSESHPELRRLAEVLGFARRQALLQGYLDDDREKLHHGNLDHEARVIVGHHYETIRHQACVYNHLLRGCIESSQQYFDREQLLGWLTSASQGRHQWAVSEVTGSVSEVALHAALQGLPEIRGLRYASVEEDLSGYDFVGMWQGLLVTIDAKTGSYPPINERKHGHRHLEISVPHGAVKDLSVTRHGLALLRREVRESLRRDTGSAYHAPHHYYRTAAVS